jgi:PKD repeat protein
VDVKVNGEKAGTLPCVDNEVSGFWKPDSVGTKTVTLTAYNEFGLTATVTANNISVHENHPPTVTIPLITDGMTLGVGSAYKLDVSAVDPDQADAITDVNLVIDGKLISTLTQPPYSFQLGPLDAGIYMVQATAHDQHGSRGDTYIYKVYVK